MILSYDFLIRELAQKPRDLHTMPQNNREPKWFYAYSDGKYIMCSSNTKDFHSNKCQLSGDRKLSQKEMQEAIECYKVWKEGESVNQYYHKKNFKSRNIVYWKSILNEFL